MKRVTIIETGLVSEHHRARHGSLPEMFERMIGAADTSITCDVVSVISGEPLPDPGQLQAILITGSPAGVYDKLGWIAPLEHFVRAAHANRIAMVGVCFGHQLMAQALGGTVQVGEGLGHRSPCLRGGAQQWRDRRIAPCHRLYAPGPGH